MNRKSELFTIYLMTLLVFIAGCIIYPGDSSYSMRFIINETGEPLDGNVFNNNNLLGYAQNGSFNTSIDKLRPGLITLNGTYKNQPFEFYFEFPRESLNYSRMDFSVKMNILNSAIFNASLLEVSKFEHEIFDLINEERRVTGIKSLKWNDRIATVAKNYSRTLSIEGFHHKDIEGKDVGDRLKENKIFYIVAAENLYMLGGLNDTANISKTIVDGWLSSPGHRSPIMDRDELYSDSAVGMYCESKTCYAVMVFAGVERYQDIELEPRYLTFLYLYDPTYPFDYDVPVFIEIDSTENINIYYIMDREQYENILNQRSYQSILEVKEIKKFSRTVVASKGHGIVIETPEGGVVAKIKIHLRYA